MSLIDFLRTQLNEGSAVPLYRQLAHSIREAIEDGKLQPGDRLDSERLLTERLGLSRSTVRAALGDLIDSRFIASAHGRGSFVLEVPQTRQVRILIPERFRPADWGPHPFHYDLIHEITSKIDCRIRYEHVPNPSMLRSIFEQAANEYHAIAIFRPIQSWIDELFAMTADGEKLPLPTLLINRDLSGSTLNFVTSDHLGGAQQATETLLRQGHRRIGFISADLQQPFARQTLLGHRAAMDRIVPHSPEELILQCTGKDADSLSCEIAAFLKRTRPTAVALGGTVFPIPFEMALKTLGWKAPDDISAIACTEHLGLQEAELDWTSMIQPIEEVTQVALEALRDLARGQRKGEVQLVLPDTFKAGSTVQPAKPGDGTPG